MNKKLNIIYLHSHDTGRYISPYGYKVRTPNLQRFAEEGVVFRQCFCANPTCSPSRAALLTGEYAHSCGMYGLAHRGFKMPDYSKHITHTLRSAGYKSYLLGIQHIIESNEIENIGYDEILGKGLPNTAERLAPVACDFLEKEHAEPFFLSIGCFETHRAFPEHEAEDDPRWIKAPEFLPDTPETRLDMANFNTMAHQYDNGVGQILDSLDKTGLSENTLVIITTDHGIAFPRAKCNMQDSGIGVLLMMRGPLGFEGGKVIDSMVSHVDVFPTICDAAGIDKPSRLQGKSFLPLISGEAGDIRDEIFSEVNFHAAYEPLRCVRTKRYKYLRRWLKRDKAVMPNCDNGYSKSLWEDSGWLDKHLVQEELYDLMFDPNETNNLINNAELAEVADDLRERLEKWMRETNDPALNGMPGTHCTTSGIANDQDEAEPNPRVASRLTPEFCKRNEIY
jgi:N-sulfoglucosamine sulfohydrolase